jgi:hypothetical protein
LIILIILDEECSFLQSPVTSSLSGPIDGSLVTTAWHFPRLRMEETASRYGG